MALINSNHRLRTLITLSILLNICLTTFSDNPLSESEILLKFKDTISNNSALSSWNASKPLCPTGNWVGVYCLNDRVWGLRLERMGLKGSLNMEALKDLKGLRTISIMGNEFEGEFPNIRFVSALKSVYLSDNKLSGEIKADAFNGMILLKKVHAARNQFSGPIPVSLTILPRLLVLMLEQNKFTGELPNFQQERLYWLNVSNNQLDGPVPQSLAKFDASSFLGNKHLCGGPLPHCNPLAKLPIGTIILSLIVAVAALAAIVAAFMILRHRKQTTEPDNPNLGGPTLQGHKRMGSTDLDKMDVGASPVIHHPPSVHGKSNSSSQNNSLKLTFLRDDRERFELADLLRASAEILGSGVFGSTYKAAIGSNGPVMVVKRYRQMNNVGREEFQEHMRRLGRLRHQNLLPLVGFYYRKEEKLLVSDYIDNVSLAVHLHGNRLPRLDWPKRLKIVKGVARGLLYLYNELSGLIAPHGHLKSANVLLLNDSWEPLLTDYALSPIVNQEHAQDLMIAYKSPEYRQLGRITKKTDVWSLGILILEVLTGRFPTNTIQQAGNGKGNGDTDLATWVQSCIINVREEDWMEKVFDKDIGGIGKSCEEEEMVKLLKIGLGCCEMDVEKRWDMKEVVERIEEVS